MCTLRHSPAFSMHFLHICWSHRSSTVAFLRSCVTTNTYTNTAAQFSEVVYITIYTLFTLEIIYMLRYAEVGEVFGII